MPQRCPYTVGTNLTLQSPTKIFTVNIENAYIPFTQSQVLKVKLNNLTPGDPEYAVLKLFDRRFFERPSHPWDQSKEDALLQFLADVETGVRKDDYDGKDSDDYEDWDWERKYRVVNQELFQNEATVYEHLCAPSFRDAMRWSMSRIPLLFLDSLVRFRAYY